MSVLLKIEEKNICMAPADFNFESLISPQVWKQNNERTIVEIINMKKKSDTLHDWELPAAKDMSWVIICPYCIATSVHIGSSTSLSGNNV